ncbi:TP901 family phage tail tape measure protein [Ancylobacter aquaticus]|uniref:TP901 family phage tail tape measure protein n=1 Tax=Ancylobacter aquaticus TaxID=100 RepID=A0A4R1I881_ANCAQ|nr:phage tail tape measure protein [Ancylobacter aquaticus]TCK28999.1 TP901 family phage tail tape measure protein [Ancylobacter aquaticus]
MASLTSILSVRLVDGVTAPAAKAGASVRRLQSTVTRASVATAMAGRASDAAAIASTRVLGAVGGIAGAAIGMRAAITSFAELERTMTRVGITAGASAGEVKTATADVGTIADKVGVPLDQVVSGLEALVAAGRSLPEAMAFLPAVVATAHAAGAQTADIASTADALATSFKIAGSQMQAAFDILVQGGNLGKFELRDMARYLPSLAANAAAVGLRGEEGVRKLVAMLQVMRSQMGNSEEAASSMSNIFAKMESQETAKRFMKFGVNLRKEMAQARREGKDLLEVFIDLAAKATKGDLSKIPQLFSDMEFARGMRSLLAQREEVGRIEAQLKNSAGSVAGALSQLSGDTMTELDRLSNKWDDFVREIGALTAAPGVGLMEGILQDIRGAKGELDDFSNWLRSTTGMSLADVMEVARKGLGIATPEEKKAANDRRDAERANPDLARAREIDARDAARQKEMATVEKQIAAAQADYAALTPTAKDLGFGAEIVRDIEKLTEALKRLREASQWDKIAAENLRTPPPPVEVPIDAATGRASFHNWRARQAEKTAQPAPPAAPMPEPNPLRGPAITVPPAAFDEPAPPKVPGDLGAAGAAALGDLSAKAGEAKSALDQVGATRVAPAIDAGSIDEALAKIRLLRSEINAVNASTVAPRMGRGDLGQSLRGIHSDAGID